MNHPTNPKRAGLRRATLVAATILLVTWAAPPAFAEELDEAEVFFELNDTDGDLGIHASIDGGPYVKLEIVGPGDKKMLKLQARKRLRRQGLTQLSFESAEPTFDELDPEDFFRRFPEGTYTIRAVDRDDVEYENESDLSHVLAAPPSGVTVDGFPSAEDCDADLPVVADPVTIDWAPVTTSHPELGEPGSVVIELYQIFVETEDGSAMIGVDLPPGVTQFDVPSEILALSGEFKFEIIARTEDGNNTAIESCFEVE